MAIRDAATTGVARGIVRSLSTTTLVLGSCHGVRPGVVRRAVIRGHVNQRAVNRRAEIREREILGRVILGRVMVVRGTIRCRRRSAPTVAAAAKDTVVVVTRKHWIRRATTIMTLSMTTATTLTGTIPTRVLRVGSVRAVRSKAVVVRTRAAAGSALAATTVLLGSSRIGRRLRARGQVRPWAKVGVGKRDEARLVGRCSDRWGARRWVAVASKGVTRHRVVVPIRGRHRAVACVARTRAVVAIIAIRGWSVAPRILI